MDFAEVVIREIQGDRTFKIFEFFAESIRQPGQSAAVHPQSVILLFDMGSGNPGNIRHPENDGFFRFHDFVWL